MKHIGSSISLCARATRTTLNRAPVGEFRERFFPQSNHARPCGHNRLEIWAHILNDCSRFLTTTKLTIAWWSNTPFLNRQSWNVRLVKQTSLNVWCYHRVIKYCSSISDFSLSLTSLMSGSVASDLVLIFLFTFLFVVGCVIVGHLPRTAIFFFFLKKIIGLLHGAWRQAVVSTQYLLK